MSYTYTEFKDRVSQIVRDDLVRIDPTEMAGHCQEALKRYSKDRPRRVMKDIAGAGVSDYSIPDNLTSWVKGFSIIRSVEYPADETPPNYLDAEDWSVYEKESGEVLRLINDSPAVGQTIRILYTALHAIIDAPVTISIDTPAVVTYVNHKLKPGDAIVFSSTGSLPDGITAGRVYYVISTGLTTTEFEFSDTPGGTAVDTTGTQSGTQSVQMSTVPESDEDAIANLAASICSGVLASIYAQSSDSTIGADSVDHKSKSDQYAARSREQKKSYLSHMGIKEGDNEVAPASAIVSIDVPYPGGGDRLTHPKRYR